MLAWVLREAATNVVRHSGATHCTVDLGSSMLAVTDDGRGCSGHVEGNGLRGVRERVTSAGGALSIGPGPDGRGTTVRVELSIRVLLADDQALVRGALAALLSLETDLEVVAEVGRGDEVVEAARRSGAQVCLLDIEMPGTDGIEAARRIATACPGAGRWWSPRSDDQATFGEPSMLAPVGS